MSEITRIVIRAPRVGVVQHAVCLVQRLHIILGATTIRMALAGLALVQALDLVPRGVFARAENLVIVAFGTQVRPGILEFECANFNDCRRPTLLLTLQR